MTQTAPRRTGPSTGGPATRLYRMYRFYDEHGALLYIGITGRIPFRRLMEHVCDKPWADLMARWDLDPGVWATEGDVLAAETAAIRAELPLFNIDGNLDNPGRIPPWEAQRQRAERDAARGVPAQRPAPTGPRQGATRPRQTSRRVPGRPGIPTRIARTLPFRVATLWLLLTAAGAVALHWADSKLGMGVPVEWQIAVAGAAWAAVIVKWWRKVRRLLRRRR